jgi:hypothetical protein
MGYNPVKSPLKNRPFAGGEFVTNKVTIQPKRGDIFAAERRLFAGEKRAKQ